MGFLCAVQEEGRRETGQGEKPGIFFLLNSQLQQVVTSQVLNIIS